MLSMPIEKIELLLNQAALIELPIEEKQQSSDLDATEDGWNATIADTEAYQALLAGLEDLSVQELYELLALAQLSEEDEEGKQPWSELVQESQDVSEDEAIESLLRALILTDAIEAGLEKLGYGPAVVGTGLQTNAS